MLSSRIRAEEALAAVGSPTLASLLAGVYFSVSLLLAVVLVVVVVWRWQCFSHCHRLVVGFSFGCLVGHHWKKQGLGGLNQRLPLTPSLPFRLAWDRMFGLGPRMV